MLLAIDVGNTNTVFALYQGKTAVAEWRIRTEPRRTADEYFVWLRQLMSEQGIDRSVITGGIIASVAPQTIFNLKTLCRRYYDTDPLVIGEPECVIGVEIRIDNPKEVGADRLVNAVAGLERYGPNLIIVDFGTATTFDVVDEDGAYGGGIIAPGVNLSLKALHDAAAKLPNVDVAKPERVIGKGTVGAMQSGVYWGYASLIEGLCRRIEKEHKHPMTVIATGGLSPLFASGTEAIEHVDPDLTMRGLVEIYRLNRGDNAVEHQKGQETG